MAATRSTSPRFTPWGRADHVEMIASGIAVVSTPSHGGVWLSAERNALVPAPLRETSGWYEEDCEASIPTWVFWDLFAQHRPEWSKDQTAATIRNWFPEGWEAVTGEVVTAADSSVVARADFAVTHADHFLVTAAFGTWQDGVPAGHVGVAAALGGIGERRWFLVPAAEYQARSGTFVVDPERHQAIDPLVTD